MRKGQNIPTNLESLLPSASDLTIRITLVDEADNLGIITDASYKIDAKTPTIAVYAPSPSSEGSKYLYGNKINLMFAAEDDVQIAELQYRFTFNYGGLTGVTSTSPWANAEGVTDVDGDGTSLVSDMEFSAGTFDAGQHAITVRALIQLETQRRPKSSSLSITAETTSKEKPCVPLKKISNQNLNLRLLHRQ